MKLKKSVVAFSCLGFILLVFIFVYLIFFKNKNNLVRPKVITPVSSDKQNNNRSEDSLLAQESEITTLVPLLPTETLISTLIVDIDGDAFDDQIVAVHKAGSSYVYLIIGLYNSESNSYDRVAQISTEISKVRTFSFNSIDITGNHKNALIYQGVLANGDSVMKIYHCNRKSKSIELLLLGDFTSDGTIFIQQTERSEAYELSQAKGESFKVWVYSSDKTEEVTDSNTGVSQIQTEYSWNAKEERYVQSRQLRITGSRLAARELSRIQNGNVDTFAEYLDGLWYKTNNNTNEPRYIYFNYKEKEVIFLSSETEEVYAWEDSNLRRSGIYLTVVNSIISSMKRRFDIMLTGVNEVYIHVRDNIGMVIKETNLWDGTYKKMSFQTTFGEEKKQTVDLEFLKSLESDSYWVDQDGNKISFIENSYKYTSEVNQSNLNAESIDGEDSVLVTVIDEGIYITQEVGANPVIQFSSKNQNSILKESYLIQYDSYEVTEKPTRRNAKPRTRTIINKDIIHLKPVNISPTACYALEGKIITLQREKSLDTKSKAQ